MSHIIRFIFYIASHLSWTRIWAISGVCFQESIRRRVLWITPLTILGLIIISQLQKPLDEQDAIRQTIKYCLFATGTLLVLTTVILAATNLPKEIDSRVIFLLVTKPCTRLEIVLGKVIGFARVSAAILLIMGVFTYGYLRYRSWVLVSEVSQRLTLVSATDSSRPTLEHYASFGLLHAKQYARPEKLQSFGEVPPADNDPADDNEARWFNGGEEQLMLLPFDLPIEAISQQDDPVPPDQTSLEVQLNIPFRTRPGMTARAGTPAAHSLGRPTPFIGKPPARSTFGIFVLPHNAVGVNIQFLGADRFSLFSPTELPNNGSVELETNNPTALEVAAVFRSRHFDALTHKGNQPTNGKYRIWVQITGTDSHSQYGATRQSVRLYSRRIALLNQTENPKLDPYINPVPDDNGKPPLPILQGRTFMGTQQLRGIANTAYAPIAQFAFRKQPNADIRIQKGENGQIPLELRFTIEGTGDESMTGKEVSAKASIEVFNLKTHRLSPTVIFPVESNRSIFTGVPAEYFEGGNYDIRLRCLAQGNSLLLRTSSVAVVTGQESFFVNLCKSLLVMWLMSVLVIMAAICCSTFVSWPIAVVLTVLILLSRWGIDELGDAAGPGIGNQVATEFFGRNNDPAVTKAISSSIEGLSTALNRVSKVLPDISAFSATEDIERGVSMPLRVLWDSTLVILKFGVPMTLLAYVILKKKEVAP